MSKNSIRLMICGTECIVGTEDNEAYVTGLAREVEACMTQLSGQSSHASDTVTAIVAALSFCDEWHRAAHEADTLRQQIRGNLEDRARARREAEEAKKETARLQQEVAALRARLGEGSSTDNTPPLRADSGRFSRPTKGETSASAEFLQHFENGKDPVHDDN